MEPAELAAAYLTANGYFITRLAPSSRRGWIRAVLLAVRLGRGTTSNLTEPATDPALGTDSRRDDILLVEVLPMEPPFSGSPAIDLVALEALTLFGGVASAHRPTLLRELMRTGSTETETGARLRHVIFWGDGPSPTTPARVISTTRAKAFIARPRRTEPTASSISWPPRTGTVAPPPVRSNAHPRLS